MKLLKIKTPVFVYTDGGCMGPGLVGAWAYVVRQPGQPDRQMAMAELDTTNNQMELMAAIKALQTIPDGLRVVIHSDSQYVIKGWNEYLSGWLRRDWRKSDGKPAKNKDFWQALLHAADGKQVTFKHVKGHSGHEENELCDQLCSAAMKKMLDSTGTSKGKAVFKLENG